MQPGPVDVHIRVTFSDQLADATRRYFAGDVTGAIRMLDVAEEAARAIPDVQQLAVALSQKAGWLREIGDATRAATALSEADDQLGHLEDPFHAMVLAFVRMEKGIVARRAGELDTAQALLREAEEAAEGTPWYATIGSDLLGNIASVALDRGQLTAAKDVLTRAAAMDRSIGNLRGLASDLNVLGLVAMVQGDHHLAQLHLKEALKVGTQGGFP